MTWRRVVLSYTLPSSAGSSASQKVNSPGKNRRPRTPRKRACPAGNRRPRTLRTSGSSRWGHRVCGPCALWTPATSSRRRARSRRAPGMDTYLDRRQDSSPEPGDRPNDAHVAFAPTEGTPTHRVCRRPPATPPATTETAPQTRNSRSQLQACTHFGGVKGGLRKPDPPLTPSHVRVQIGGVSDD
jgi:hypothetical protein